MSEAQTHGLSREQGPPEPGPEAWGWAIFRVCVLVAVVAVIVAACQGGAR